MRQKTAQQIKELQSALQDPGLSKTEFVRIQAILFRKRGLSREETSVMVGKSIHAIEDWMSAFHKQGARGLRSNYPKHSGRTKLTQRQRAQICERLKQRPDELGYGKEEYWTMKLVKRLVERETGIEYRSENSYRKLLNEAGLSYQRVEFVDRKKDKKRHDDFKNQLEMKIKGGRISMWW